jgi:flagellar motor switch protein FliN/FliY
MTSLESFDSFADIGIDIEAQMDRIRLTVRQILELDQNSVIKLSRSVGENVEILAGGAVVGQGEIVVAHGRAAIHITEFREED